MLALDRIEKLYPVPPTARKLLQKPEKEIHYTLNLRVGQDELVQTDAYVVYWNTARGPAKGGIRFAPHVTLAETADLAERMVWKTALVGVPFGGGKSGVAINSRSLTPIARAAIIKEFVHLLRPELDTGAYIPAPDMGTTTRDMAVIFGEVHRPEVVTGKPPNVGGLPGREQATGRGVATCTRIALQRLFERSPQGARIAIQGFGNVGSWTAKFLIDMGAKIVAAGDENGGIVLDDGLDVEGLMTWTHRGKWVKDFGQGSAVSNEELLTLDVDVLVPAAVGGVLHADNADQVRAGLIVEAANGPTTPEAHLALGERGIRVIPDILANAGGVIASYAEWRQAKSGSLTRREETYQTVDEFIDQAFRRVDALAQEHGVSMRLAAETLAVKAVCETMDDRGWL